MLLTVVTSRSWKRKMFVGVQRGFQTVRDVLIFHLDGEYIPVWFIIILHRTCLCFMHVSIHFYILKQKKKFQAGVFFRHHIIFKVFLYKGFSGLRARAGIHGPHSQTSGHFLGPATDFQMPAIVTFDSSWRNPYLPPLGKMQRLFEMKKMCVCPQLCLTLCDPMDCGPLGSSVHRIL